jgi:pyruvate carboxylase
MRGRLPQLLSLECWGGATFDVSMRFLTEDPWERLELVRQGAPNLLLQMLLRGANGVGYKNYPDNVVKHFVRQAAQGGIDLFRVFDCLNWVENMRVSMDAVSPRRTSSARQRSATPATSQFGAAEIRPEILHRACRRAGKGRRPYHRGQGHGRAVEARGRGKLFKALREATDLPIHFHTHDTSGISAATVLAAVDSGVDAVDAAMDALSGNTSQPCLGSIVEALKGHGARSRS